MVYDVTSGSVVVTLIQLFSVAKRLSRRYAVSSTPPVESGLFQDRVNEVLVIADTLNGLTGIEGGPYLPLGVIDSSGAKGGLVPTLFRQ